MHIGYFLYLALKIKRECIKSFGYANGNAKSIFYVNKGIHLNEQLLCYISVMIKVKFYSYDVRSIKSQLIFITYKLIQSESYLIFDKHI